MSFFRRLFRADAADPPREPVAERPAEPPPAPEPQGDEASWWATSSAEPDTVPPKRQTAELAHAGEGAAPLTPDDATPPELPQAVPDDSETPTAPQSAISAEQARAYLAAQAAEEHSQDAGDTPPEGTPLLQDDERDGTRKLPLDSAPAVSAHRSAQGLAAMAARDIGRVREVNQDSVLALLTTLPRAGGDVTIGLFIVADGMGGHQGGEVASRLAVRTIVYQVLSQLVMPALDESMTEALQPLMISAVQAANEAIWDSAQLLGTDMGTTCTAALLVGNGLYIAHVGDSRAYLLEPGGLRQLTADHSTVGRLIQLGQLDPSEAREHPLRNQLYRTVGQQPQVMVDFVYQLVGQSSQLLLCSDGLWGLIDEPMLEQALARSPWPQDACNELIALANLAGGDDNISAVVVALPIAER